MSKRLVGVAVLAVALAAVPAHAQKPLAVEVGGFGQFNLFDKNLEIDNTVTLGGRAGVHLFKRLWAEGDIQFGKSDWALASGSSKSLTLRPWAARLVYAPKLAEKTNLLIGAGYQNNVYVGRTNNVSGQFESPNEYEDAFTGLLGLKQCLNEKWNLRGDLVGDYNPSPNQNSASGTLDGKATNFGLRVGLGYSVNGKCYEKPAPPPPPPAAAAAAPAAAAAAAGQ
ncbi:MAG: outer membrane beta-barrel protein [Gemmatimonadetes bacterium]|nr:outer membrane beta-barrel protein [Gemmatimonadota bacterium]